MSFKWKTSLLIASLFSIILIVTNIFVLIRFERSALRNEKDVLNAHIAQIADDIRKNPRAAIANWASDVERGQYIVVHDVNGRILFEKGLRFRQEWVHEPPARAGSDGSLEYTIDGQHILVAQKEIRGALDYSVTLYENTEKLDLLIRNARKLLLYATAAGMVVAAAGSYFIAGATLRPVGAIIRRANEMDVGDLSRRLPLPKSRDELYALTATLNGLLARIEEGFRKQRRFVADASHELRTPLTIIEGHANMMKRWGSKSAEITAESLEYIMQETARLRMLTERLLQDATLERADGADTKAEPADWTALTDEVCSQLSFLNPSVTLVRELPGTSVLTRVPKQELTQTTLNVLDNAVKYTPAGGSVRVALAEDDGLGMAMLTVADTGIGIAQDELSRIFEPFYRADKSRSREQGGSGLGLSIVKKIVDRYGGSIRVESSPGQGTTVCIRFPRAECSGTVISSS